MSLTREKKCKYPVVDSLNTFDVFYLHDFHLIIKVDNIR